MAKKYGPITVVAYAQSRGGGLIDVDTLNEAQRRELATELKLRMLNGFYAGQGVTFYRAGEEGDGHAKLETATKGGKCGDFEKLR